MAGDEQDQRGGDINMAGPAHLEVQPLDADYTPGPSSSRNSQSTTDGHDGALTPPTSDGRSSQGMTNETRASQWRQESPSSEQRVPTEPPSIPSLGQKRTVDGRLKQASHSPPAEPSRKMGHVRAISSVSNASSAASRIGEVGWMESIGLHIWANGIGSSLRNCVHGSRMPWSR